jgi:hypothetical protein
MKFRKSVFVVLSILLIAACAFCTARGTAKMPKDDPNDPLIAMVGDTVISTDYVKIALSNMPLLFRSKYNTEEGKKQYIESLIDMMAYYHEGLRRQLEKKPEYQEKLDIIQKLTLIHMAKDKLFDKLPPVSQDDLQKAYDHYKTAQEKSQKTPISLAESEKNLRSSIEAENYKKAFKDRVAALKEEYGYKMDEEVLKKAPKDVELKTLIVESRAFNLTMADFIAWAKTLPGYMKRQMSTAEGRQFLVNYYVENELLFYDAFLQKLDKTPEFDKRMFIVKVSILGQITMNSITAKNIQATNKEAKEFYEKHQDQFKGESWEKSQKLAEKKASTEKRERVSKELAFALRRDRYPVHYWEDNIKKLDLSTVTKGEVGLAAFPIIPKGTEIVDLDSFNVPAKSALPSLPAPMEPEPGASDKQEGEKAAEETK